MSAATLVRRALGGHAAIGLLAGAILYLIALSGTLVVIHDRWQRWEQPAIVETATLSPGAAQAAIVAGLAQDAGKPRTTHIYLRMPTDDLPRPVVTTDHGGWYVDGTGRVVAREAHGWTEFLIALHEYLHLPLSWGMIVVGATGVAMMALVVTGVLAHPRILRDAFRLRARHDAQLARADWHNRLGVWTLPFALAVALTGATIGLGSVGYTVLARAYTGGDLERAYAPVFGTEPKADPAPAPLADVAAALRTLAARVPRAMPTYVIVHDPGTRGQHIQILAEHPRRLIYGENYAFDAAGRWRGALGLADGALGKQAAASAYNLHFGNFGGLAIELAYMAFGTALCIVIATGTSLWLERRRRRGLVRGPGGDRLRAAWDWVIWGAPLLIVAAAWLRAGGGGDAPLAGFFWSLFAIGTIVALVRPALLRGAVLREIAFAAILATAIGHAVLLRPVSAGPIVIDLVAGGLSAIVLLVSRRMRAPS